MQSSFQSGGWGIDSNTGQVAGDDINAESTAREADLHHEAPTSQVDPEASLMSMGERSRKVLIVEDTTELAEVISATLERINLKVFHETHVERALAVYYAERPDVILLDIGLPDKTGWKLLDEIKKHDEFERPAVVVISAHGDPANRLMGKLQGVHSYLIKPFTPNEVEQVVGRALSSKARGHVLPGNPVDQAELPDFIQELLEGKNNQHNPDTSVS